MYLIVGAGRMARHLCHYFDSLGVGYRQWRRDRRVPLTSDLDHAPHAVLLLIPDGAITEFIAAHPELAGHALVHFSGSLASTGVRCCHPLASFGPDLYEPQFYRTIPFVCDPGTPAFTDIFPRLPNPHHVLSPEHRPLYHALAVLAGNFSVMLWEKLFAGFEQLGLPREAALPYLESVASNLRVRAHGSITGPLARGDLATIRSNLDALADDPYATVYRAFVTAAGVTLEDR